MKSHGLAAGGAVFATGSTRAAGRAATTGTVGSTKSHGLGAGSGAGDLRVRVATAGVAVAGRAAAGRAAGVACSTKSHGFGESARELVAPVGRVRSIGPDVFGGAASAAGAVGAGVGATSGA